MNDIINKIFCCPLCESSLSIHSDYYNCPTCDKTYPVILGIPDFRVTDLPPNYRTKEQDLEIANYLHNNFESWDYPKLVTECVNLQDEITKTDPKLTQRYINYRLNQKHKIEKRQKLISKLLKTKKTIETKFEYGIDFGCGSGAGMVSLVPFCRNVMGIDIQLSELIVARKYLMTEKIGNFFLFAGSLEKLPFKRGSIFFATSHDVLEHIQEQGQHLIEVERVLNSEGIFYFNMPNRYLLGNEPHVNIRGVGFFPRFLQDKYVRIMSLNKKQYIGKKLLSIFELNKLLKKNISLNHSIYNLHSLDKNNMIYDSEYDGKSTIAPLQLGLTENIKKIKKTIFCNAFYVVVTGK